MSHQPAVAGPCAGLHLSCAFRARPGSCCLGLPDFSLYLREPPHMWAWGFSSCSRITKNTATTCLSCHAGEVPAVWSPGPHPMARPKLSPETTSVPTEAGTPGPQEKEGATSDPRKNGSPCRGTVCPLPFSWMEDPTPHPPLYLKVFFWRKEGPQDAGSGSWGCRELANLSYLARAVDPDWRGSRLSGGPRSVKVWVQLPPPGCRA